MTMETLGTRLNSFICGGGQGAEAWENRGREGYGRRKRKGRDAGKKCKTRLLSFITMCQNTLKNKNPNEHLPYPRQHFYSLGKLVYSLAV